MKKKCEIKITCSKLKQEIPIYLWPKLKLKIIFQSGCRSELGNGAFILYT